MKNKSWIIISNNKRFRVDDILNLENVVAWYQEKKDDFQIGDIIYVYSTKPIKRIKYKMVVIGAKLASSIYDHGDLYYTDKALYQRAIKNERFAEFQLVTRIPDNEALHLEALRKHGFNDFNVHDIDGELLSYIEQTIASMNLEISPVSAPVLDADASAEVSATDELEELVEGNKTQVLNTRYERNKQAREQCLKAKGYKCAVCGFDFAERYGKIGEGFIHVHHTTPIASIGQNYQVDPVKDLVPVCANCHAMLHRKEPPYSIEELKGLLKQEKPSVLNKVKRWLK